MTHSYTAPKYEAPKHEVSEMTTPDNNKLEKLTRELCDINDTLNDLSSSTMEDIRKIKEKIQK